MPVLEVGTPKPTWHGLFSNLGSLVGSLFYKGALLFLGGCKFRELRPWHMSSRQLQTQYVKSVLHSKPPSARLTPPSLRLPERSQRILSNYDGGFGVWL